MEAGLRSGQVKTEEYEEAAFDGLNCSKQAGLQYIDTVHAQICMAAFSLDGFMYFDLLPNDTAARWHDVHIVTGMSCAY